jgi:osmotically-inducible protein OsmY
MVATNPVAVASRDHELARQVIRHLCAQQMPSLRSLKVVAEGGVVTLVGQVRTFHQKQVIQRCCRDLSSVLLFVDAVRVVQQDGHKPL